MQIKTAVDEIGLDITRAGASSATPAGRRFKT